MGVAVVEVINLRFRYAGSSEYVLRRLNLTVGSGELVIVTGPTGSGKTTLCRVLTGLIPKLYRGELAGRVRVAGMEPAEALRAGKVVYVGPNPEEQFLFPTVDEELRSYGINENVLEGVLTSLGLKALRESVVFELSMGEKQRVTIAAAIAKVPNLLILDEALTFIDEPFLTAALNHVVRLAEQGSAVLVVTKAPHVIRGLTRTGARLVLIEGGTVKVTGNARSLLMGNASDAHPFLAGLRAVTAPRHGTAQEVMRCRAS